MEIKHEHLAEDASTFNIGSIPRKSVDELTGRMQAVAGYDSNGSLMKKRRQRIQVVDADN